jgi:phosphoribulokinase
MSARHPIIAVTGSSGAGTSTFMHAFERVFAQLNLRAAFVEGDAFHAYDREQMQAAIARARIRGENFSHFGPQANLLDKLEALFASYGSKGTGNVRRYLHTEAEAIEAGQAVGTFTPWEKLPPDADMMVYEGLHGGVVTEELDIAQHVDLLIGVAPIVNLEWIQKLCRDTSVRGHAADDVTRTILRRMPDYVNFITPQFSRTDINFQRVPLVDVSDPFVATRIPRAEESLVVVRFAENSRFTASYPEWLSQIPGAFMSRADTMVVPGQQQPLALELILRPAVERLAARRRNATGESTWNIPL